MPGIAEALLENPDGTVIAIEVTAGGKKALFPSGYNEWRKAIGCRVAAPAIGGRANRAVMELVAETLGRPTASITILSGATSSQKRVLVTGMEKADVLRRLE
jgi:uncharacterized protein